MSDFLPLQQASSQMQVDEVAQASMPPQTSAAEETKEALPLPGAPNGSTLQDVQMAAAAAPASTTEN